MAKSIPPIEGVQPSGGPFSQVVVANGFVFLAGQVGDDPVTGKLAEGGFEAEARQVFANVRRLLGAVGLGTEDVVRATVYLVDMARFAEYNAIWREFFPTDPPARATIHVAGLVPPYAIEAEVTAAQRAAAG
jgi:2-iminobutanoate/2-iminopropanoate deaminase